MLPESFNPDQRLANSVAAALRRTADGERFRLCPVRASATSATIAPDSGERADGAFDPVRRPIGAIRRGTTSEGDALKEEGSRNLFSSASQPYAAGASLIP